MQSAAYHVPNALDRMFFAFDYAAWRMNMPGAFVHFHLETGGQVDPTRLRRALACVYRRHPATGARLERSPVLGAPRWRLRSAHDPAEPAVELHEAGAPHDAQGAAVAKLLLNQRIDTTFKPPLQLHVIRGDAGCDLIVMRHPHALMDGRGSFRIIEEIDRFYREEADPDSIVPAREERRDELADLLTFRPVPARDSHGKSEMRHRPPVQLPMGPEVRHVGALRWSVRRLTLDQCADIQAIARRVCPDARFGAFLRATALRALRPWVEHDRPRPMKYTVPYLMEGRKPPFETPVCRNLYSLERMSVPAETVKDRAAVARSLHEQTARMLERGFVTRHLLNTVRISRLPTAVLGSMSLRSFRNGPARWQRGQAAYPPSLPMGFMQTLPEDFDTFCGVKLEHVYAFRPPLPRVGVGFQVFADRGSMTLCGLSFAYREEMMNAYLDQLVLDLLTDQ